VIDVPVARGAGAPAYWRVGLPLLGMVLGAVAVLSPVAAIAFVVGAVYAVIAFSNLAAGVVVFILLSFLERLPGFHGSNVTAIKGAAAILLLAWLAEIAASRGRVPLLPREHPVIAYGAVALILVAAASVLWATDETTAQSSALRLAQGPLVLAIIFSGLREPRHLRWALGAYVAGAVVTASMGFFWTRSDTADLGRLSGGIGDPNELAAALLPAIPVALFAMATVRSLFVRWALVVCVLLSTAAIFMTGSRGGLIGMAVMFTAAFALAGPLRQQVLAGGLAVIAVAFTYYTLFAPPEVLGRITSFTAEGGSGRTDIWSIALQMFRDHPVFGIGAGNFPILEPSYALVSINLPSVQVVFDDPHVVHNTYLHVLVELGIVGLACFGVFVVGVLAEGVRALSRFKRSGDRETEILARGLVIGVLAMLAAFTFLTAQFEKELWLLLGMTLALANLGRETSVPSRGEIARHPLFKPAR
jgi:O-antigen ligase